MEYQKIINFLDNTLSQPTNFRTKIWVENITLIVKLNLKLQC